MKRIAVLVSGGGTDLQSIIDAAEAGYINAKVDYVVSSKAGVFALERARKHGIDCAVYSKTDYPSSAALCSALAQVLLEREIDLIVLAGYLNIVTRELIQPFTDRIINIHPSLIPKHCGMGYYGIRVHESVIKSKDTVSGATVHFVNEIADGGKIIMQREVPVFAEDTAETLAARVLECEHKLLPDAIREVLKTI